MNAIKDYLSNLKRLDFWISIANRFANWLCDAKYAGTGAAAIGIILSFFVYGVWWAIALVVLCVVCLAVVGMGMLAAADAEGRGASFMAAGVFAAMLLTVFGTSLAFNLLRWLVMKVFA